MDPISLSLSYWATFDSTILYGIQSLYLYIFRTTGAPPDDPNNTDLNVFLVVNCSLAIKKINELMKFMPKTEGQYLYNLEVLKELLSQKWKRYYVAIVEKLIV